MRGAVLYAPGDLRVEERDDPTILEPTDAVVRLSATCVCGSDLWPYRGIETVDGPSPMGHEYAGIVEQVGSQVTNVKPGQFVVGSFFASDNTCEICQAGYQTSCINKEPIGANGAQAEYLRVPLADGTLVATPDIPADDLIPSLLAASDVLGTGWFGAVAAEAGPGRTVAVVGDGAVGLLAVLAAKQLGAERIIAMSRHEPRQQLAVEFGATDIVTERGDAGAARVKELTGGLGRTRPSRRSAPRSRCCRPSAPPGRAGTSATSASPTGSSCPARSCSSPTCTCTAGPHRCAASCPSSST
jgi:threonine dehydrogenase-like Zn-dependent dehydrogenase